MIKQRVSRVYHVGILYFYMYIKDKESDKMISIRKRGNVYQYCFEAGKVNGKRKQITKSGVIKVISNIWYKRCIKKLSKGY